MTVSSIGNAVRYAGDGSTTAFSFPFFFISTTDLWVLLTDSLGNIVPQTLGTNYTVSGTEAANGTYPGGGAVTMNSAPNVGYTLSVIRTPQLTQGTHWVDNDPDPAAVKELAFDKLTLLVQYLYYQLSICLTMQDGDVTGFFNEFPGPAIPGNALVVNAAGTGWAWVPVASLVGANWAQEVPVGVINSSNTAFTIANAPFSGKAVMLFLDRNLQFQNVDYSITGTAITFTVAPDPGQKIYAAYSY